MTFSLDIPCSASEHLADQMNTLRRVRKTIKGKNAVFIITRAILRRAFQGEFA